MKKNIIRLLLMCLLTLTIEAQVASDLYYYSNLRVQNPRNWNSQNGKITQTSINVSPNGFYSEISLDLTFAATDPSAFIENDTLEVVFSYTLPVNSFITDHSLWIDGIAEKALILDRPTATATYEGVSVLLIIIRTLILVLVF